MNNLRSFFSKDNSLLLFGDRESLLLFDDGDFLRFRVFRGKAPARSRAEKGEEWYRPDTVNYRRAGHQASGGRSKSPAHGLFSGGTAYIPSISIAAKTPMRYTILTVDVLSHNRQP